MENSSPIELLLTELIIQRAIEIRKARSAKEPIDGIDSNPEPKIFFDLAIDELKDWHPYVTERLKAK